MLRAVELGISINDLDLLSVGMLLDMFTEKVNDMEDIEDEREATSTDFDNF